MVIIANCNGGTEIGNPSPSSWDVGQQSFLLSVESNACVTLTNPVVSKDGFVVHKPEDCLGDHRAQEADYIFLAKDTDAVALSGPTITAA